MGKRNKKIKYNERLDLCPGHNCPLRRYCYRYCLDRFYGDAERCQNPPTLSWWVEPAYAGGSCKHFIEAEYK